MGIRDKGLEMLRTLPRVAFNNIRGNREAYQERKRDRGMKNANTYGLGRNMSKKRMNHMRIGYETGNSPFYLRFGIEPYYKGHHLRRQYPPLSLHQLQMMIDTDRLDITQPIDLSIICNTGLYFIEPAKHHFGVHLTDEGADLFKAKINIEVQWTSEPVIAAIERNGGVITTSYFDIHSLQAMVSPEKFFEKGVPIPRRMLPPGDAIEYYTSAANRGYLADPEKISFERFVLAQKYGYELPRIEDDPDYEMLVTRKDTRQIFYGLEPGWVVSLQDKCILKPTDSKLLEYYKS